MDMSQICPWCDTEIVWDEVLGPEEECPHCHNELNAYRTMNVDIEHDPDKQHGDHDDHNHEEESEEKGWSNFGWTEDAALFGDESSLQYQEGVDKVLHGQSEVPECPQCREYMLLAGTETIGSNHFEPHVSEALKAPVVTAPFRLDVYVCTSCFQVSKVLAEPHREPLMEVVRRAQSE